MQTALKRLLYKQAF